MTAGRSARITRCSCANCAALVEIEDADFAALAPHDFAREDIWDIAAIAAFFAMSNRLANVMSIPPNDEFYALGRG